MPKIIENLEPRLIAQAKRLAESSGLQSVTIRAVANGCGVGVGTVYNYFPSKESLLAAYLLSEWEICLAEIQRTTAHLQEPEALLQSLYNQLMGYGLRFHTIWGEVENLTAFASPRSPYHALLRSQLAQLIRHLCSTDFLAEFIAEALLTWTLEGVPFPEIYQTLKKLF